MNPDKPTQGSLEDLFRHHLLESEQAAVPPSPRVWEQIDNSLLLAQNATFRRRLGAYRLAMAASLLLAFLVSVGWWRHRAAEMPAVAEAAPAARGAGATDHAGATREPQGSAAQAQFSAAAAVAAARHPNDAPVWGANSHGTAEAAAAERQAAAGPATNGSSLLHHTLSVGTTVAGRDGSTLAAGVSGAPASPSVANGPAGRVAGADLAGSPSPTSALGNASSTSSATVQPTTGVAGPADAVVATADVSSVAAFAPLTVRPAALLVGSQSALPTGLAVGTVPPSTTPEAAKPARAWQFGLAYAASAFNPNVNFERSPGAYNPALGPNSADVTRAAAAEYRDHLQAGLGQRLSLRATRRLGSGGRLALSTGLEVTQSRATSASSMAFVGEQVPDVATAGGPMQAPQPLQRTSYRYRTAGVPVEVRYAQPVRNGFSLYGRVGAVVSALLGVRTDVAGTPEATRTYSIGSAGTPYRRVTASVRGGAGVQYRPAGSTWAFTFGPVAEAGLLTLNAEPAQDYLQQSRPYSVGLEAGVEFGRAPKAAQ